MAQPTDKHYKDNSHIPLPFYSTPGRQGIKEDFFGCQVAIYNTLLDSIENRVLRNGCRFKRLPRIPHYPHTTFSSTCTAASLYKSVQRKKSHSHPPPSTNHRHCVLVIHRNVDTILYAIYVYACHPLWTARSFHLENGAWQCSCESPVNLYNKQWRLWLEIYIFIELRAFLWQWM